MKENEVNNENPEELLEEEPIYFRDTLKDKSNDEIIAEILSCQSSQVGNIMGAWGASVCHELMHKELDNRGYEGERPSRKYKPNFIKRKE